LIKPGVGDLCKPVKRSFSIITACKGRLEHLKLALPQMLAQPAAELIVVDYSCPDRTADYVEAHHPGVRVVRVEGEAGFSNWKARNYGAAAATAEMLVFCDADTILADNALGVIDSALPPARFGFFTRQATARFNKAGLRLGHNQLRGFQAVPLAAFRKLGGYDDVLEGYAAGGDTDLEERLALIGVKGVRLGDGIIDEVVQHDNAARFTHHQAPIQVSYAAGLFYRRAKLALMRLRGGAELSLKQRQMIYAVAQRSAQRVARGEKVSVMQVNIEETAVGMPRQLGFESGKCAVSINVKLAMDGKIDKRPD
jgi:glycosyltransferase involved in cell wall biosynthesis